MSFYKSSKEYLSILHSNKYLFFGYMDISKVEKILMKKSKRVGVVEYVYYPINPDTNTYLVLERKIDNSVIIYYSNSLKRIRYDAKTLSHLLSKDYLLEEIIFNASLDKKTYDRYKIRKEAVIFKSSLYKDGNILFDILESNQLHPFAKVYYQDKGRKAVEVLSYADKNDIMFIRKNIDNEDYIYAQKGVPQWTVIQ